MKVWAILIIGASIVCTGCKQTSYANDNKARAKHLASLKSKFEEPGQQRVKSGNLNDGF